MTTIPDTLCYLNGDYLPLNQAKVSVLRTPSTGRTLMPPSTAR